MKKLLILLVCIISFNSFAQKFVDWSNVSVQIANPYPIKLEFPFNELNRMDGVKYHIFTLNTNEIGTNLEKEIMITSDFKNLFPQLTNYNIEVFSILATNKHTIQIIPNYGEKYQIPISDQKIDEISKGAIGYDLEYITSNTVIRTIFKDYTNDFYIIERFLKTNRYNWHEEIIKRY